VAVAYRVSATDKQAFLSALGTLSEQRRRDGAYAWGVAEDAAKPEWLVEWFFVESWTERLRQHRRVSKAGHDVEEELLRFHIGPEPPTVSHLVSVDAFSRPLVS
jgi:hypothetical protein